KKEKGATDSVAPFSCLLLRCQCDRVDAERKASTRGVLPGYGELQGIVPRCGEVESARVVGDVNSRVRVLILVLHTADVRAVCGELVGATFFVALRSDLDVVDACRGYIEGQRDAVAHRS